MPNYVWKDGHFRDKETGNPMPLPERDEVQAPMVMTVNFEPYRSVVTGKVIDGQRARKEEIAVGKEKGLVPFERINGSPGGYINPKYQVHGKREQNEATKEWAAKKRAATAVKTDVSGAVWSD